MWGVMWGPPGRCQSNEAGRTHTVHSVGTLNYIDPSSNPGLGLHQPEK